MIQPIVEGHGEVSAVPILMRRLGELFWRERRLHYRQAQTPLLELPLDRPMGMKP